MRRTALVHAHAYDAIHAKDESATVLHGTTTAAEGALYSSERRKNYVPGVVEPLIMEDPLYFGNMTIPATEFSREQRIATSFDTEL